jgi:hypothetical protein
VANNYKKWNMLLHLDKVVVQEVVQNNPETAVNSGASAPDPTSGLSVEQHQDKLDHTKILVVLLQKTIDQTMIQQN